MTRAEQRLTATLTFTPAGDLEDVFLAAGSDREEAILRKAIGPALAVLRWRRQMKRALLWTFNHRLLPQRVTQRLYDLFQLRNV